MAQIIDGRAMAAELRTELRADVAKYVQQQGSPPEVVVVRVGGDTASGVYSKAILRAAENAGLIARLEQLPTRTTASELQEMLQQLNTLKHTRGIIVQMPLPGHLSQQMVADTVVAEKDIDGISPH
ncbi:MAG: tetrahydrofolate dehydrogenase/cyclohydrolase catalytic domain-containing protein, partial [Ktedonobacteraceae bacterium]